MTINPLDIFKPYDVVVVYYKNGIWKAYTHTDQYKLTKHDKSQLIKFIIKDHKVKESDIRFLKIKSLILED